MSDLVRDSVLAVPQLERRQTLRSLSFKREAAERIALLVRATVAVQYPASSRSQRQRSAMEEGRNVCVTHRGTFW